MAATKKLCYWHTVLLTVRREVTASLQICTTPCDKSHPLHEVVKETVPLSKQTDQILLDCVIKIVLVSLWERLHRKLTDRNAWLCNYEPIFVFHLIHVREVDSQVVGQVRVYCLQRLSIKIALLDDVLELVFRENFQPFVCFWVIIGKNKSNSLLKALFPIFVSF